MGDFNAKIDQQGKGEEAIMGKSNYGGRNERGNLLVEFALQYNLKVVNFFLLYHEIKNGNGNHRPVTKQKRLHTDE